MMGDRSKLENHTSKPKIHRSISTIALSPESKTRPDKLCYVCGNFTIQSQQRAITTHAQKIYKLCFGCPLGDQDNPWASKPDVCMDMHDSGRISTQTVRCYQQFLLYFFICILNPFFFSLASEGSVQGKINILFDQVLLKSPNW